MKALHHLMHQIINQKHLAAVYKVKSTGEMTRGKPVEVVLNELRRTFTLTCCCLSSIS